MVSELAAVDLKGRWQQFGLGSRELLGVWQQVRLLAAFGFLQAGPWLHV